MELNHLLQNSKYVSVKEFSDMFNMPKSTIYKYMDDKKLPTVMIGSTRRIDIGKADDFIKKTTITPDSSNNKGESEMKTTYNFLKPLTSIGKIVKIHNKKTGKDYWYLRKFPMRYNIKGEIEYIECHGFATENEAKVFRTHCKKRRKELQSISPDNPSVYDSFKQYIDSFRKPSWTSQTTIDNMDSFIENHIKPAFMDIGIKDVTTDDLQSFYLRQNKERDVKKPISLMRKWFNILYRQKKIEYNPMYDIKIPKHVPKNPQNRNLLSEEEEQLFYDCLMNSTRKSVQQYRHGILLLICSGIRPGELCGGEWENIDYEHCKFDVRKTWRRDGSKCTEKDTTKTGATGERTVPFSNVCIPYLKAAQKKAKTKWIMENPKTKKPIRTETLRNVVAKIAKEAGLTNRSIFPYLFRHMFATHAARNGIMPIDLKFIMGHIDEKMINKIYANHKDEHLIEDHRDLFNQIMSPKKHEAE